MPTDQFVGRLEEIPLDALEDILENLDCPELSRIQLQSGNPRKLFSRREDTRMHFQHPYFVTSRDCSTPPFVIPVYSITHTLKSKRSGKMAKKDLIVQEPGT